MPIKSLVKQAYFPLNLENIKEYFMLLKVSKNVYFLTLLVEV